MLIAISTSGNSKNIANVVLRAKKKNMFVGTLLGKDGGICRGMADCEIVIPSDRTSHIQEMHIMIIHIVCALLDDWY